MKYYLEEDALHQSMKQKVADMSVKKGKAVLKASMSEKNREKYFKIMD